MADDNDMRKLVEQVFQYLQPSLAANPENIVTSSSFVPKGHMTKELLKHMCAVLTMKQFFTFKRWETFCAISCLNAVSSTEMYLRYVMFVCRIESELTKTVFDKVLNVCALIRTFNIETFDATDVNFYELSVEIFMVFYKKALKRSFCKNGGFKHFAEHLRVQHIFWINYFQGDPDFCGAADLLINEQLDLYEEYGTHYKPEYHKHNDIIKDIISHTLAKEVLSNKNIKLPPLPSPDELKIIIRTNRQRKVARSEERQKTKTSESKRETPADDTMRETPADDSKRETPADDSKRETPADDSKRETPADDSKRETPADDSKREMMRVMQWSTNDKVVRWIEDEANIAWCDNIVRAVTIYNNSQSSNPADANYQIQKDASKILEHLKDTITSLIQVLDETDKK